MNGPRRKNKTASEIVLEAVSSVGPSIVRDYILEILVLGVGSTSRVGGLKEFCALAVIVVALDCVGLFTLYVSVLAVVVEVRRIRAMRVARRVALSTRSSRASSPTLSLSEFGASSFSHSYSSSSNNYNGNAPAGATATPVVQRQPLHSRIVDTVFGQKGVNDTVSEEKKPVNPLTRLKLLLVSFPLPSFSFRFFRFFPFFVL